MKMFRKGSPERFEREQLSLDNPNKMKFIPRLMYAGSIPLIDQLKESITHSIKNFYAENFPDKTGEMDAEVKDLQSQAEIKATVMEFIEGETLENFIRNSPPDFNGAVACFTKIVDMLETFHQFSFLHRDLSPENIIKLPDGSLKLIDFGVSYVPSVNDASLTQQDTFRNTFLSLPEYENRSNFRNPVSDWTSAAGLFYFLLLRSHPEKIKAFQNEDNILAKLGEFQSSLNTLERQMLFSFFATFEKDLTSRGSIDAEWVKGHIRQWTGHIDPSPLRNSTDISPERVRQLKTFYSEVHGLHSTSGFKCGQTARHANSSSEATIFQAQKGSSTFPVSLKADKVYFYVVIAPLNLRSGSTRILLESLKDWAERL